MLIFGAPFPQPDHAARALGAALGMQDRQVELSARWASRLGRPIEIGIGVHSGPVVVGNVGPERRTEYAVVGDTVNVASRLKDLARPGEVLVSEATARAADGDFVLRRPATLRLRGRTEPVAVYAAERRRTPSAMGTTSAPAPRPGAADRASPERVIAPEGG